MTREEAQKFLTAKFTADRIEPEYIVPIFPEEARKLAKKAKEIRDEEERLLTNPLARKNSKEYKAGQEYAAEFIRQCLVRQIKFAAENGAFNVSATLSNSNSGKNLSYYEGLKDSVPSLLSLLGYKCYIDIGNKFINMLQFTINVVW